MRLVPARRQLKRICPQFMGDAAIEASGCVTVASRAPCPYPLHGTVRDTFDFFLRNATFLGVDDMLTPLERGPRSPSNAQDDKFSLAWRDVSLRAEFDACPDLGPGELGVLEHDRKKVGLSRNC
jgi:hypothetical protein